MKQCKIKGKKILKLNFILQNCVALILWHLVSKNELFFFTLYENKPVTSKLKETVFYCLNHLCFSQVTLFSKKTDDKNSGNILWF